MERRDGNEENGPDSLAKMIFQKFVLVRLFGKYAVYASQEVSINIKQGGEVGLGGGMSFVFLHQFQNLRQGYTACFN